MFAEDEIILQKMDYLQNSMYRLNLLRKYYNLNVYTGNNSHGFERVVVDRVQDLGQWTACRTRLHFTFLRSDVSYEIESDVTDKFHNYQIMCGTIQNRNLIVDSYGRARVRL